MATITELWLRYTALLKEKLPNFYAQLNPPASQQFIDETQSKYALNNITIPQELIEIFKINNGEGAKRHYDDLNQFYATIGFIFLGIEHCYCLRDNIKDIFNEIYSIPEKYIENEELYWIGFGTDECGGGLYVDLNPDVKGKSGQVIGSGRDEEMRVVFANSLSDFLLAIIRKLERGDYSVETSTHTPFYYDAKGGVYEKEKSFSHLYLTKNGSETSGTIAMSRLGIVDEENDLLGVRKR